MFLAAALSGSAAFATPLFSVAALVPLASGAALPSGFNSAGTAVGYLTDASGDITPIEFKNGNTTTLPGIGEAAGINAAGTVIGTSFNNGGPTVTEWSGGKSQKLKISGYGNAINDAGQIAGGYETANGQLHAFTTNNGSLKDLGTLGGKWSSASSINQSGQAAGSSTISGSSSHAFFWNGSSLADLGTLGGANSYGNGLNSAGTVVGSAQTSAGYLNAFSWSGKGLVDLGTLGGLMSAAYGVNDAGDVVGYSTTSRKLDDHAFYETGGVMMDLNGLLPVGSDWTLTAAYAIDDAGDILATGLRGGEAYAVELSPDEECRGGSPAGVVTPEPAALLLTGAGLLLVARFRRPMRSASAARVKEGKLTECV